MNSIAINPVLTSGAPGSFNVSSEGYIQGVAMDDPAVRNALAGGYLDPNEVLPMWGGVAVSELVPSLAAGAPSSTLGTKVSRAKTLVAAAAGQLTGFSVFNQVHSMVSSPQSPVPLAAGNMTVEFFRLRSRARIPVLCDAALAAALQSGLITAQVSWDFGGQQLAPFQAAYAADVINNATWLAGVATFTTAGAHGLNVGSDVSISGITPAGYNGFFKTIAGTAGVTIKVNLATNPGAFAANGQLDPGGGALPVQVLDVNIGNSMTVQYDPATGFATWNRNGTTAIIQI